MKTAHNGARRSGEVQNLIADVEELLARVTNIDDADIRQVRERVTESMAAAREAVRSTASKVQERAASAARMADDYAYESPWTLAGFAAAAGLIVGMLVARR